MSFRGDGEVGHRDDGNVVRPPWVLGFRLNGVQAKRLINPVAQTEESRFQRTGCSTLNRHDLGEQFPPDSTEILSTLSELPGCWHRPWSRKGGHRERQRSLIPDSGYPLG